MRASLTLGVFARLAVAVAASACGRPAHRVVPAASTPAARVQTTPAAVARARADSVRHPYTEADIHFMSAMIGHHTQTIVMAGWAQTHAATTSVRRMATRVIDGQQEEIVTAQRWLRDRNQVVPEARTSGLPGMLTETQLKELDQARGSEFDRLFLKFMIQHHRGGVSMVQELFGSYGAAQDKTVFKFASDVNADQTTEIARMERLLDALTPNRRNQP